MANKDELTQRLRDLEAEQEQQFVALEELSKLESTLKKTLAALEKIPANGKKMLKPEIRKHINELSEVHRLKQRLDGLEKEQIRQEAALRALQRIKEEMSHSLMELQKIRRGELPDKEALDIQLLETVERQFLICLIFENQPMIEWSEKGWQPRGKGRHYPTLGQATTALKTIRQKWAGYRIEIVEYFNKT